MRLVALALASSMMGGCVINSHSSKTYSGVQIGPNTFGQLSEGETTEEWVLAAFGEPSSKTGLADGTELWKWVYSRNLKSRGSLLFVFGGSTNRQEHGATYVEMYDGVVVRAWQD